jgi:hypothetical protein
MLHTSRAIWVNLINEDAHGNDVTVEYFRPLELPDDANGTASNGYHSEACTYGYFKDYYQGEEGYSFVPNSYGPQHTYK